MECEWEAGLRLTLTTEQLGGWRSHFPRWGRTGENVWGEMRISKRRCLLLSMFSLRLQGDVQAECQVGH